MSSISDDARELLARVDQASRTLPGLPLSEIRLDDQPILQELRDAGLIEGIVASDPRPWRIHPRTNPEHKVTFIRRART